MEAGTSAIPSVTLCYIQYEGNSEIYETLPQKGIESNEGRHTIKMPSGLHHLHMSYTHVCEHTRGASIHVCAVTPESLKLHGTYEDKNVSTFKFHMIRVQALMSYKRA